jgi:5-bromo-4-chloroindolyl phosphate hydrolysis protein
MTSGSPTVGDNVEVALVGYIGIGVVLLILGWLLGIYILWILGIIAIVIGLVFFVLSTGAYAGAGRRPWYHRRYW